MTFGMKRSGGSVLLLVGIEKSEASTPFLQEMIHVRQKTKSTKIKYLMIALNGREGEKKNKPVHFSFEIYIQTMYTHCRYIV